MTVPGMPCARTTSARTLVLAVLLTLLWTAAPARADYVALCTGYAGCRDAGYSAAGYKAASDTSYWRMYTGHNCTNYVAYRMVRAGLPNERPWSGGGNAEYWGLEMSSITDRTPMVGAVAWWAENVRPAGSSGHVAYVERVVSSDEIWISEDSWSGDFHWRRVTRSGTGWPSGFIHFRDVPLRSQAAPTISGDLQVGQTLTASTGAWAPSPDAYTYQWLADGQPLTGATASTLLLGPKRLGKHLSVKVQATEPGYAAAAATSAPTAAVEPGTLVETTDPVITGRAEAGSVLTLSEGSWSPEPSARTVRWLADGAPIGGATGWSLTPGTAQIGAVITAEVTATRNGYTPSTTTTAPTEPVKGREVTLTSPFALGGTARVGRALRVTPGTYTPTTADVAYTWLRDGAAIAGAAGPAYVPGAADVGRRISVRVDLSAPDHKPLTQTTDATDPVRSVPVIRLRASGGPGRARVAVAVRAPGVPLVLGKVLVQVGPRSRVVRLVDGRALVVLRDLPAGTRRVVVHYLGQGLVDPGVQRGEVLVTHG